MLIVCAFLLILILSWNLYRSRINTNIRHVSFQYLVSSVSSNCYFTSSDGWKWRWKRCDQASLGEFYTVVGTFVPPTDKSFFTPINLDISSISLVSVDTHSVSFLIVSIYRFLLDYFANIRSLIINSVSSHFSGDNVNLVLGLVLGSFVTDFGPEFRNLIKSLGLSHMVAVSGFHLSVVFVFLSTLFSFLSSPRWRFFVISIFLLWYAFLVSTPLSLLRALFMMYISSIGRIFFHKAVNSFYILFQVLAIMCLFSVFYLSNAGFQLSFLATAGILLFGGLEITNFDFSLSLNQFSPLVYLVKILSLIKASILTSLSAQLLCLPVLLSQFGEFAVWGVLSSLLFSTFLSILVSLALPLLIFSLLPIPNSLLFWLLGPLFLFLDDFCSFLVYCLRLYADKFGILFTLREPLTPGFVFVYYLLVLLFYLFWRHCTYRKIFYVC